MLESRSDIREVRIFSENMLDWMLTCSGFSSVSAWYDSDLWMPVDLEVSEFK